MPCRGQTAHRCAPTVAPRAFAGLRPAPARPARLDPAVLAARPRACLSSSFLPLLWARGGLRRGLLSILEQVAVSPKQLDRMLACRGKSKDRLGCQPHCVASTPLSSPAFAGRHAVGLAAASSVHYLPKIAAGVEGRPLPLREVPDLRRADFVGVPSCGLPRRRGVPAIAARMP